MPTAMYLHDELSDISLGTNNTNKAGASVAWRARYLAAFEGDVTNVTATVASVTGPTNGLETGNPVNEWISDPLAAPATISGTITFNICALESNAMANAGLGVVVQRVNNVGTVVSTIVDSIQNTELGTSNARRTWTATPTSTAMAQGDRIRVRVYFDDAGGTMVTGYTLTLTYDGTNAATGDSNVTFTENLTFMSVTPFTSLTSISPGINSIKDTAYGENTWALATDSGIYYSSSVTGPYIQSISGIASSIAYGNGVWVATISSSIYTATSMTGPWSLRFTASNPPRDIKYANGVWVVGGYTFIVTATDPTGTWTEQTLSSAPAGTIIEALAYGNGVWVAVGAGGFIGTATDPAGTWTFRANPGYSAGGADSWYDVAYSESSGIWVAVGLSVGTSTNNPSAKTIVYSTSPTTTWTLTASTFNIDLESVAFGDGVWVLGSRDSSTVRYMINPTTDTPKTYVSTVGAGAYVVFDVQYESTTGQWLVATNTALGVFRPRTTLYLTSTASTIADQATTELTIWTDRGNG